MKFLQRLVCYLELRYILIVEHKFKTNKANRFELPNFRLPKNQVYLVIGYYMRHRETVDDYIRQMDKEAERLRQEWEAEHPPTVTKAELLARLQAKQNVPNEISGRRAG